MTRWPAIVLTVFSLLLSQGLGDADGSRNIIHPLPGRIDRLTTSSSRPSSYMLTQIDDGGSTENKGSETGSAEDKPSPPSEKKHKSDKARPSRSAPLKPMSPSEEIKADQEVDFPYDI
ncbi:MAG: hypothetical protein AB1Z20_03530 [Desulfobacterales bacterium]